MKPKDLRDEFALAALPQCVADTLRRTYDGFEFTAPDGRVMDTPEAIAVMCGEIADAMMAEREKSA